MSDFIEQLRVYKFASGHVLLVDMATESAAPHLDEGEAFSAIARALLRKNGERHRFFRSWERVRAEEIEGHSAEGLAVAQIIGRLIEKRDDTRPQNMAAVSVEPLL